jgi:hypothetical protein
VGYKYKLDLGYNMLDSVDFNLVLTYIDRSIVHIAPGNKYVYRMQDVYGNLLSETVNFRDVKVEIRRMQRVLPVPYITFNFTEYINIDFILLLDHEVTHSPVKGEIVVKEQTSRVFFIRAGFTFY